MTPLDVINRLEEIKPMFLPGVHTQAIEEAISLIASGAIMQQCQECERRRVANLSRVHAFRARQPKRIKP